MEKEKIEVVRDWPEPQSVRDIQVFLGFANFYRSFIRNFNRIAASLTSRFQTIGNDDPDAQASQHEKNQDTTINASNTNGAEADGSIKNLSTVVKLVKSKKPKLTKPKKSDLVKVQNFAKTNSSGTDFLTFEAKKAFIQLQKTFIETPILKHFDPKSHIKIETYALGYAIGEILCQITLDQQFSGHVTYKDPNSDFPKSEID